MSAPLLSNEIENPEDLPDTCVFHRTDKEPGRTIVESGFDPSSGNKFDKPDEQMLKNIAESENLPSPNRMASTFFYPTYEQIVPYGGHLGTCVIVVDISEVSADMWVADMEKYDSVISQTPLDDKKAKTGPYNNDQIRVVREYLQTMTPVNGHSDIRSTVQQMKNPEIIVEGRVPKSAIVGVLL